MTPPRFEVADVIRAHGGEFLDTYGDTTSPEQRRALADLARCRAAALGGHVEECDRCGHRQIAYNSRRDRHCPKCRGTEAARWVEARAADLPPVEYFHVVFTIPAALGPIAPQNPRVVYGLLFRAAAETLRQIAADPKHLGAEIGLLAVLHTRGQDLQHHPHVHRVAPGGGLSADGSRWVACRPGFFLPVRVLGRLFRGKFLALLKAAFDGGKLSFHGQLAALASPAEFRRILAGTANTKWVVYAKPPFGGPEQVLRYLARSTHRAAISNHRLIGLEGDQVEFLWKDYAHGGEPKTMKLQAVELLRRFLMHILATGFLRNRHYGFLANRVCREKLELCRRLLAAIASGVAARPISEPNPVSPTRPETHICPACGEGRMVIIETLTRPPGDHRGPGRREPAPESAGCDTS